VGADGSDVVAVGLLREAVESVIPPASRPLLRRRLSRMVIVRPSLRFLDRRTSSLITILSGPRRRHAAESSRCSRELETLVVGL
jgi:hypothetical protein